MNKTVPANVLRRVSVLLVAVVLLFCAVAAPQAEAADYKASYIKERNDLKVNTEKYFDSNVMMKLPEGISDDDEISVIITVDVMDIMSAYEKTDKKQTLAEFVLNSEKAEQIRKQIKEEKDAILANLDEKAISYEEGKDFNTLLTGFELIIKAGDLRATSKSLTKGSKLVMGEEYKVSETQLVNNKVSVYDTGIFDSSNVKFDGTGMVVAVLDTGLDYAHSAFSTGNFTSNHLGLTKEQVAAVIDKTTASGMVPGLTADNVYISEKVPFGFDYADGDPDVYSDHNNHGTHVSGVICGKDDTITGVAPNAQLVSMKVFSSVMDTARSAWILSALEDCVILGVDVINMSLGQSAGFSTPSTEDLEDEVYAKVKASGISLIVAASNSYSSAYGSESNGNLGLTSNPDTGTVGSPGTYPGALSVASINGVKTPYLLYNDQIIYFNETTNGSAEENNFFDTLLKDKDSVTAEFVLVPGVGRTADYSGMDVTGKIVLVRRGSNTFEEKAMIAQKQGAAGIIIYNNVSGDIKMNVGDAKLAACSISQDMGEMLAEVGSGTIVVARSQTSGPFISDFSSWGPTPELNIKPEITAHGGNILSAITGGAYDRMSGTSMACPNVAGVTLLLRQYVVENFPEIADDSVEVNKMINRLMMSTADIILGKNGLPYAIRKQGAGLANLESSINSPALLLTYDKNGNEMDKTKLELGDDPKRTGVYEMTFTVRNFGSSALSYDIGAYIMTEGVSDTLTNAGETTVTEEAYILEGAKLEILSVDGGKLDGKKLTVEAGKDAKVSVKVVLSDADKKYMDDSFENGMYVEGFITLTATAGTEVNLSVPYLAFYGDWTEAPLLDLDYFETDADERDDTIPAEDKTLADGYATRPIGGVSGDYVSYLGSYYFVQDPADRIISANRDYIALSNQDGTIHSLSYIWAGMLRNAEKVVITITDDATGEVIYETVDEYIRKSYGDGGPIRPANIDVDFDAMDFNLMNNSTYTVKMQGYLDYGNGGLETNENNTFEFPLTMDFQAPVVEDVEFYYEYDKTLKKNRLYARVAVYDNHYAMSMQLGYAYTNEEGNIDIKTFEQYMTPIYSQRNSTTFVTYELTDYIEEIKAAKVQGTEVHDNSIVLTCYDYALNFAIYEIGLPDNHSDFYFDGLDGELVLNPNEVYSMAPVVYPSTEWAETLEYTSSRPNIVRVVNNKLVACSSGKAIITVRDPASKTTIRIPVTVRAEGDEGYKVLQKPVTDKFELSGYYTNKAYFQLSSEDKLLGNTGDTRFFEGNLNLSMYPSESVTLNYVFAPYFPNDTKVVFTSGNENIVKVDPVTGEIVAVAEGYSSVTAKVMMDDKNTLYSQTVTIEVKNPFINTGASLTHYFGNGGVVEIPADLHLTSIGAFAFSNFDYVTKTPEELAFDDSTTSKQAPIGDNTITKVIIPEGVERIDSYAFSLLTALEEVVLPSTLTDIAYCAFEGCENLKTISFSGENNLKLINYAAFNGCNLTGYLDLPRAYVIGNFAFQGNENLEGIKLPETLQSIGAYAFSGCEKLEKVEVAAERVKYGEYAFAGCSSLVSFPEIKAYVIPAGMFYNCSKLESVTIGADVASINEYAFRGTALNEFVVADGNTAFKAQTANYVISADGTTLIAVAPTVTGEFTAQTAGGANITTIARGAFSHNAKLTSVKLPAVTVVGAYAFAGDERLKPLTNIELGELSSIGDYGFSATGIQQLPKINSNTVIGKYAFAMSNLTSVYIPNGMTVGEGAFSRCQLLVSIEIGDDVTLGDFSFFQDYNDNFDLVEEIIDGKDIFYYVFGSNLKSLTIGKNAVIGANAFANASQLETITLGEGATIGNMAFYNNTKLKNIDLSKALTIGEYAFSGDVFNKFFDSSATVPAYSSQGQYLYSYHGSALQSVDLSSATSIGQYAFAICRDLVNVTLGENITVIPAYAFAQTAALKNIDLSKVEIVREYAFMESAIEKVDLSSATTVEKYAFANCKEMNELKLNPNGTAVEEGAFAYCEKIASVENLNKVPSIGAYAFAYTAITKADLSSAASIGDAAFLKDEKGIFEVILGQGVLVSLGDNPFAGSVVAPFFTEELEQFNGKDYWVKKFTFDLSDTVKVINGSLYCVVPNGMELTTFAGTDLRHEDVAEGTVRISAMAFTNSDLEAVTLPHSLKSVGHKAFFGCDKLGVVTFKSFYAPILEEEFDASYYDSFEHLPGSGDYGNYTDYDGSEVTIVGNGTIPYFMWNATGGMYSNVFYGANFQDYVGYVDNKLLMVRPSNGMKYDTYMFGHYFGHVIDGGVSMDGNTLAFIDAMNQVPERISLEHRALVEAARAAYDQLSNTAQRGLVDTYYSRLLSAERRIQVLLEGQNPPNGGEDDTPGTDGTQPGGDGEEGGSSTGIIIGVAAAALIIVVLVIFLVVKNNKKKAGNAIPAAEAAEAPEAQEAEETQAQAEDETTTE